MTQWSLSALLESLHNDIENKLKTVRQTFAHPVAKGDASELVWLELFNKYLPARYHASKAFVVDSEGTFSEQIDIVIYDHQYTPFIFSYQESTIIPAESVYAVFEAKQTINAENVRYAAKKLASVRQLRCTSLPIPHAGGVYPPKPPIPILGGILAFDSGWQSGLTQSLQDVLAEQKGQAGQLDIGCVAAHGYFFRQAENDQYQLNMGGKPATAFLFKLISLLQFSGTVPMIDVNAYSRWLAK